jgi:hypothetical protein
MNGIVNEMGTLISHIVSGQLNWVKMWSYNNFVVIAILFVHKILASIHLVP